MSARESGTVAVWGAPVRLMHGMLIASVATAWFWTFDAGNAGHIVAGYTAAAVLVLRLVWGALCGPRSARLTRCLRFPRQLRRYAGNAARGGGRRYLGHNPLGSAMVIALILCALGVCFTGWLFTTDRFWGYGWLSALHAALAWSLVGLIGLHVAGVLFTMWRHGENLIFPMMTGRKLRRLRGKTG